MNNPIDFFKSLFKNKKTTLTGREAIALQYLHPEKGAINTGDYCTTQDIANLSPPYIPPYTNYIALVHVDGISDGITPTELFNNTGKTVSWAIESASGLIEAYFSGGIDNTKVITYPMVSGNGATQYIFNPDSSASKVYYVATKTDGSTNTLPNAFLRVDIKIFN